ncbi:unnamed protein product [Rhizophagus irregularis]|nr:unnamed protein product [Rhizophagus irregularis]
MFARYRIREFFGVECPACFQKTHRSSASRREFLLPRRTTLLGFSTELALADDCLISLISSSILAISILGLKLNNAIQNRKICTIPYPECLQLGSTYSLSLSFEWSEHPAKRVQTRPQVLPSFLICGQE